MSSRGIIASCFWGAEKISFLCPQHFFCWLFLSSLWAGAFILWYEKCLNKSHSGSCLLCQFRVLGHAFSPSPSNLSFRSSQKSWEQFLCRQVKKHFEKNFTYGQLCTKSCFHVLVFFFIFHRGSSNPSAAHQMTVGLCNLCCCFHTNKWNKSTLRPQWRVWGFFFCSLSRDLRSIKIRALNSL